MKPPDHNAMVLIAEDRDDERDLLKDLLTQKGYEVVAVGDGEEALREAGRRSFDLIVLDVHMPKIDGVEACRRLRKLPLCAAIPILFLTAADDPRTVEDAFAAGGSDFLAKPYLPQILWSRVANLLEAARLGKEVRRLRENLDVLGNDRAD